VIGRSLSHYRITEKIGAGGMGEVYRAEDLHLARDVAIKVLPAGTLTDEAARRRFRHEALALSKLNHPNIQTVHDFDTQEEVDFLVVEFIPGPTLADKLAAGALPEKEIASLGSQIAAALEEAHERGVVHRDLKPGNIKVTPKGQVKVLDFGIAKLLKPAGATATTESFTDTHGVAGTLPYMAPEQLRGEAADPRSDIWAAGVLLYEMATARLPFEERVFSLLSESILHRPPPAPSRLKPGLSPRLEEIILKCLEKDPDNRYQSARDLLVDFRRLTAPTALPLAPSPVAPARGTIATLFRSAQRPLPLGTGLAVVAVALLLGFNVGGLREKLFGAAAPKFDSLAVLPLENLSGDPEQEYFADGMHEELIATLGKIGALKVISRTSVMQYKQQRKPLPEIARELGVDAVIEGSVRRAGDQVRITVQLVDARADKHLWAKSYQREIRDILALQTEVAQEIAQQIRVSVTPEERTRLESSSTVNSEAYQLYLKGLYYWVERTPGGETLGKSREYFEQAIEKDPAYAHAYAGLANAYVTIGYRGLIPTTEAYERARAAAKRALELDESLGEAHLALAGVMGDYDWDWAGADREFKRAIELSPNFANAHNWYSQYLTIMGQHDQAIAEAKRAVELDPLSIRLRPYVVAAFFYARRYDEAIEQAKKIIELDPNWPQIHSAYALLGVSYLQKGMHEEAFKAVEKAETLRGASPEFLAAWRKAHKEGGIKGETRFWLQAERLPALSGMTRASMHALLGEKDRAFELLDKLVREKDQEAPFLKVDPCFDSLRSDPRYHDLLRRMGLPP